MAPTLPAVTVFFSYSGDDNLAWSNWIGQFRDHWEPVLRARLKREGLAALQRIEFYQDNGAIHGELAEELSRRVQACSALLAFVGPGYVQSEACWLELDEFKRHHGDDGLRRQLYVVALSADAMARAKAHPRWQQLAGGAELVWINAWRPDQPDEPLVIQDDGAGSNAVSLQVDQMGSKIAIEIVRQLKQKAPAAGGAGLAAVPSAAVPPGVVTPAPPIAPSTVPPAAPSAAPAVGGAPAVPVARRWLLGLARPELQPALDALATALAQRPGQSVARLELAQVAEDDLSALDTATDLVLACNGGAPLLPALGPTGHLGQQQAAWVARGKAAARLHWLDLQDQPTPKPASPAQAAALAELARPALRPAELLRRLDAPPPAPAAALPRALIYIESNPKEQDLWVQLGAQLEPFWNEVAGGPPPELRFTPRGLPIERLDSALPLLDSADGLILLWGRKPPESLLAQIDDLECRIQDRLGSAAALPPRIVAYLMPPQPDDDGLTALGWRLLRFRAGNMTAPDEVQVEGSEADRLRAFLREVYLRARGRPRPAAAAPSAVLAA